MKIIKTFDSFINEGRKVIKRKYGERNRVRINEKAKLRNSIILEIGNKTITLDQLKALLNKIAEGRGKTIDGKRWFKSNSRYITQKNEQYKLSPLGLRVYNRLLEMDYEEKMSKITKGSINECSVKLITIEPEDRYLKNQWNAFRCIRT